VQGLGDIPPVHDQLAEQDPEREVGGHRLAAVEAERRRRPVALDLVADGGEVAAEPPGQLLHAAGVERADLGVVQLGKPARVRHPGAAALGTGGEARGDGDDVGGGLPDRPVGGVGHPAVGVGRRGDEGGEALADLLDRRPDAFQVAGRGLHAAPPCCCSGSE
jgi:hypothetical protein